MQVVSAVDTWGAGVCREKSGEPPLPTPGEALGWGLPNEGVPPSEGDARGDARGSAAEEEGPLGKEPHVGPDLPTCPGSSHHLAVPLPGPLIPSTSPVLRQWSRVCVCMGVCVRVAVAARANVLQTRVWWRLVDLTRPVRRAVSWPGRSSGIRSSSGLLWPRQLSPGRPRGSRKV